MEPLAVDLMLLRVLLTPEIKIVPGRAIMARVVTTAGESGKGALSIAGELIDAELPKDVKAGQDIRLVVKEVTPQRVVLTLSDQSQAAVAVPQPAAELPGGGTVRRIDDDDPEHTSQRRQLDSHTITLRYDAPALGAVDLRLSLDPASLAVRVELPYGRPVTLAEGASTELRDELAQDSDRTVSVTVTGRHEPLDVFA